MKKGTTICSEENSRVRAERNFDYSESQKEVLENIQSLRTRLAQNHQNKINLSKDLQSIKSLNQKLHSAIQSAVLRRKELENPTTSESPIN